MCIQGDSNFVRSISILSRLVSDKNHIIIFIGIYIIKIKYFNNLI